MSDGGWLNAPAGLLRKDGSAKPAYDELLKLVKGEWWISPTRLSTDSEGKIRLTGFFGEYELSCGGERKSFSITREGTSVIEIHL
jgi:hypothetical protein